MTKQDVTYLDKLNELRLDVNHPNSAGLVYILVEGDSDIRLFRKFFDLNNCKVEAIPGGKFKLEECVDDLLKSTSLVIGIRDADFIHLGAIPYTKANLFLTDYHDLEMTFIVEDEAFRTIIYEYTDIPKKDHLSVRDIVINSIEDMSYFKWLNEIENLEFKFDSGFQDLITLPGFKLNFHEYFNRVISKSPDARIKDVSIINSKIDLLKASTPNRFQLCNGHDFMKALSQFIKQHGKVKNVNDDIIAAAFRMVFRNDFLNKTTMYANTDSWAKGNSCAIYT